MCDGASKYCDIADSALGLRAVDRGGGCKDKRSDAFSWGVYCARRPFCTPLVLSTEIELRSSLFPSLTGTAGTEAFEEAFGSAGGGAISAGLKSGSGGFDCFLVKNDLQVPDFDLRR